MAYEKLQGRRAINVYPADGVKIPTPAAKRLAGSNSSVVASQLVDATADFVANQVQIGDIVYNNTAGAAATVTAVVSATVLQLSANIFLATPASYTIYKGNSTDGPVLFVGTGGDLTVLTVGLDEVTFTNLSNASFIPVMVYSVQATGTSCSDIIAIW